MRNSPGQAKNHEHFFAFSATGWTVFKLIRYTKIFYFRAECEDDARAQGRSVVRGSKEAFAASKGGVSY